MEKSSNYHPPQSPPKENLDIDVQSELDKLFVARKKEKKKAFIFAVLLIIVFLIIILR